jgi:hypothetical protein
MSGTLHEMFERIERLPDAMQAEAMARIEVIFEDLEDQAWEEAFADPASDAFFAAAEAEIAQSKREGKLIPLVPTIEEEVGAP